MTHRLPHDAVVETPSGDHHAAIAALQRTVAELEARVAQLEQPPARWLPLKAAAHDANVKYETARKWAERGLIEARREGKLWLVNVVGLKARKDRLAGQVPAAKPTLNAGSEPFGA
jgi:hypothetical protein